MNDVTILAQGTFIAFAFYMLWLFFFAFMSCLQFFMRHFQFISCRHVHFI